MNRGEAPDVLVIPTGDSRQPGDQTETVADCEDITAHVTVETSPPMPLR